MKNKGVTLVEMLMSLLILGMITIYAIPSFTNGISMVRKNKLKEQAVWYLQNEMERLRATEFIYVTNSDFSMTDYDFFNESKDITNLELDEDGNPTLKKVTLTINWEGGGAGKEVKLITVVSKYGINEKLQ